VTLRSRQQCTWEIVLSNKRQLARSDCLRAPSERPKRRASCRLGPARASVEDHENAGDDAPRLGLTLAAAAKVMDSGSEGVVVTAIDPDGRAAGRGFKVGDVILDVGGKAVSTAADVRDALRTRSRRWQTSGVDANQVRRRDEVRRGFAWPSLTKRFNVVPQTQPGRGSPAERW
jgi:hypothetical protein